MYYTKDTVLFHDGKFLKAGEAHTDLFSQTLHYGLGVFEGIRAYQTQNGVKIFKAREHFERLRKSCGHIGIPFHYEVEELIQIAYQVLRRNNLSDAYIRPLVYVGQEMTLSPSRESHVMLCAWEWSKFHGDQLLKLCMSSYQRPNPASIKIEAKVTGYYVNSILATQEAKSRGYDDALMTDMYGNVAELPGANFFYEKDGVLYTPPCGHILPGITRATVIDICHELDIPLVEKFFKPSDLEGADSAFLCGTAMEVSGIESIDAKPFRKEWFDSLGATVQEAYKSQVREKSFSFVII